MLCDPACPASPAPPCAADRSVCAVTREYVTNTGPGSPYTLFYSTITGVGQAARGGNIPGGLRPDVSCTVKQPQTRCAVRFNNTEGVEWQISSREVWVEASAGCGCAAGPPPQLRHAQRRLPAHPPRPICPTRLPASTQHASRCLMLPPAE